MTTTGVSDGTYLGRIGSFVEEMQFATADAVRHASEILADRIGAGGVVHTFGTGHSALVAAEPSYRAGGLAAVNFLGLLPGQTGWEAAIEIENHAEPAARLVREGGVRDGDVVVVISHSGRSALVLAAAAAAVDAGATVIAITRSAQNAVAAHAALVLETGAPADDCALSSLGHRFGSLSSILMLTLLNAAIAGAVSLLIERGSALAVLESVHTEGGPAHNARVMAPLLSRIPCWTRMPCIEP